MRKALVGMKPDRFEDIIALVALYRPGPMENIPLYNSRKHGHEKAEYYHEKIKSVLTETYGVIIYQEQVMEIARILSGYSLGEADMLRRAMGKKIRKEMEEQRKRFIEGARERDLSASQAESIFDVLAKFADYGFNKSHAAAYALISYQTAWLKANHPIEFLAALMSLDKGNTDKLHDFYREGKRAGIEVKAPCVNESQVDFTIKGEIVHYALAAVKGAGAQAMEHIVQTREEGGAFRSVADFFSRIDARKVNRKMLENLVQAGAFDCFGNPREQLIHNLDMLINHANRVLENSQAGIEDMFGGGEETASLQMPEADTWQVSKRLLKESESLGFYLSAHPLDECVSMLAERRVKLWAEFSERMKRDGQAGSAKLAGTVMSFKEIRTKNGKRMGRVQLSDPTGQFEGVLFAETLAKHRDELKEGESVIMRVEAEERPEGLSLRIQSVAPLHEELAQSAQSAHRKRELKIFVREETALPHLTKILTGNSRSGRDGNGSGNGQNGQNGTGKVSIIVLKPKGEGEIEIDLNRKYALSAEIAGAIKAMAGIEEVQLT